MNVFGKIDFTQNNKTNFTPKKMWRPPANLSEEFLEFLENRGISMEKYFAMGKGDKQKTDREYLKTKRTKRVHNPRVEEILNEIVANTPVL